MNRIPRNTRPRTFKPTELKLKNFNLVRENSRSKNLKLERAPKDDVFFLSSLETPDPEKRARIGRYASYLFGGF